MIMATLILLGKIALGLILVLVGLFVLSFIVALLFSVTILGIVARAWNKILNDPNCELVQVGKNKFNFRVRKKDDFR